MRKYKPDLDDWLATISFSLLMTLPLWIPYWIYFLTEIGVITP